MELKRQLRQEIQQEFSYDRQMTDEEICQIIDQRIFVCGEEQVLSLRERLQLQKELFDSFRRLDILQELVGKLAGNAAFEELYNMADAGYALLQSSANQIEFYRQRDGERNLEVMRELVASEAEMALQLLRAQQRDSRIGFEASNHYMYGENTLLEKILNCRSLLKLYQ